MIFINNKKYELLFFDCEKNWADHMNNVYQYFKDNGELPHVSSNNPSISTLGRWLNAQVSNYKHHGPPMKNPKLLKLWEEFLVFKKDHNL